jgi:recombination protein RecA
VEIRRGDKILQDKEQVGYLAKIKITKNKISTPFKTAELPVKRGIGYDKTADIVEAASVLKLVNKA